MRPLGARDIPSDRHEWQREYNHGHYGEDGDDKGDTAATEDLGDFQEEFTAFDILLHRARLCQKSRSHGGPGGDLVVDRCRAPYEGHELLRDGGPVPPLLDGIEDELTAIECVLLPAVRFVIASLP